MKKKTETVIAMITTSLAIFSLDGDDIPSAIVFSIMSLLLLIHISVENDNPNKIKP